LSFCRADSTTKLFNSSALQTEPTFSIAAFKYEISQQNVSYELDPRVTVWQPWWHPLGTISKRGFGNFCSIWAAALVLIFLVCFDFFPYRPKRIWISASISLFY
jgi:hypothetical protein